MNTPQDQLKLRNLKKLFRLFIEYRTEHFRLLKFFEEGTFKKP